MIKFIFVPSNGSSGLAHDPLHCVPGLTLPLGDASTFFINVLSLPGSLKNKWTKRLSLVFRCSVHVFSWSNFSQASQEILL